MSEQPQRFGNYTVVRQLGQGSMGVVFEVIHEQIGKRAAVKVLRPEVSRDPQLSARLLNEARAVNLASHPGLVGIFEFGRTAEGAAYLVMEYLDGESLRERLDRVGALAVPDALRLLRQLAAALAAAHARGVVHRDLKPENVMLVAEPELPGGERAKILDFGVAKVAGEAQRLGGVQTLYGAIVGTAAYMAPEQCVDAADVDARADVYALGIVLYEVLTGVVPFAGDSALGVMLRQMTEPPQPVRSLQPAVPPEVAALVERMLSKEPAPRPAMTEVARAAERLLAEPSRGPAPVAFALSATREVTAQNYLYIDHPATNDVPSAVVLITPRGDPPSAVANDHPTGVWFAPNRRWSIYNEDLAPMPAGAAFNVVVAPAGFVHRAEPANIINNWTLLNHPSSNDRPDAVVLVTASWNPGGRGGVYNAHAIGVWYTSGRWAVYNQDRQPMPPGASFNVLVSPESFVHRVSATNLVGSSGTGLSHPLADGDPRAVVLVTCSWNPGGQGGLYHDHAIGVSYQGERWVIFNQDQAPMSPGAAFNVWVCPGGSAEP